MIYVLFAKFQPFCVACTKYFSLYIIVPLTACNMSSPSCLSSCRYVTVKQFCVGINFFSFLYFLHSLSLPSFSFFVSSPNFSVISLTLLIPLSNISFHSFLPFTPALPSSLYQPPRRRPSAVWSPCAATNMGRAAVPAWPASWSK